MKKWMTLCLIFLYVLMLGISFAGCAKGSEEQPSRKTAVGFVIAPTACSQGLNLTSPLVQGTVEETVLNYGRICVVNADGAPALVADCDFDIDESLKAASKERLRMDARNKTTGFLAALQKVRADSEEVDFLKSLQLCARNLSDLEGYDRKVILVVGTGLSTSGIMDFRNNLLSAEPEAIADALEARQELPALEGICVYWQQMSDTAPPQAELNGLQRKALQDIWEAVIRRGGGQLIIDNILYAPVSVQTDYPRVSTVDLPAAPAVAFDALPQDDDDAELFQTPVSLPESQICFYGDSDRYVDPEAAKQTLAPIAEAMLANPDITLLLCGCIAGDSSATQYGLDLSLHRAEAVRKTLTELSVPEERMIVRGLGTDNPWHIQGAGYQGDLAAQNRKVVLLNAGTPLAQELLCR